MDLGGNLEPSKVGADELPDGFTMEGATAGNSGGESEKQQSGKQMEEQRKMILEQACTREALARLGRIRMVRESKAKSIENSIVSMAVQGKLPGKVNEAKLIEMLERGNTSQDGAQGGQISIQRKRYAFDSDDEDNDDDL